MLTRPPANGSIEYDVALTKGVAAVRHVANTVEFLDANGAPRLRMAPPSLVDDGCKTVDVDVTVTGCTVDTDPRAPRGKRHPAPGAPSCRIALSWRSATVRYPLALDPTWTSTYSMIHARAWHTATKLPGSDAILVAGGLTSPGYIIQNSTELFDPSDNSWSAAASMSTARYTHAATAFADGEVLVAGGITGTGAATAAVEIYSGGTWVAKTPLATPVAGATADVFATDWVYVAGGYTNAGGGLQTTTATAAYYRLGNSYGWTPTLPSARGWHASVVAADGIYLLGGESYTGGATSFLNVTDRYVW